MRVLKCRDGGSDARSWRRIWDSYGNGLRISKAMMKCQATKSKTWPWENRVGGSHNAIQEHDNLEWARAPAHPWHRIRHVTAAQQHGTGIESGDMAHGNHNGLSLKPSSRTQSVVKVVWLRWSTSSKVSWQAGRRGKHRGPP